VINICSRPSFIGNRFSRWSKKTQTQRLSSRVRAEEIGEALPDDVRINPEVASPADINIYVKPVSLDVVGHGEYLDFLDGGHYYVELYSRPDIKVIACTEHSYDVLSSEFENEIILIPHHHINVERKQRQRVGVSTLGYIGSYSPHTERHYKYLANLMREDLPDMHLETNFEYKTRQDAVNTYLNMDILLISDWWLPDHNPHKIPTKIINAASYGVPAIARPLNGYKEIEGLYLPANNYDEILVQVRKLRDDPTYYAKFAERIRLNAEKYHIDEIKKLYLSLK
jgi:hypothetical protein